MRSLKMCLLLAGVPLTDMDSHESDLYVFKTPLADRVIDNWCKVNQYSKKWNCELFIDQVTGRFMYDCAFQNYLPLKPWNGTDKSGYSLVNKGICENLLVDDFYSVYYFNSDSVLQLWCRGDELSAYIHHLNQIEWRK